MLEITEDFGLLGIALGPFPLLQQLLVPGEAIDVGVRIATRAGVAVPVPSAANRLAGFINPHLQPQLVPERLQHVHAGKACANHDSVKVLSCASHFSPFHMHYFYYSNARGGVVLPTVPAIEPASIDRMTPVTQAD